MTGPVAQKSRDPRLTWVAIQEAMLERRCAQLADIAIGLYGQLGEARAENQRLRASLQSCRCAMSAPGRTGPGW
jgi:hypothetical protein